MEKVRPDIWLEVRQAKSRRKVQALQAPRQEEKQEEYGVGGLQVILLDWK